MNIFWPHFHDPDFRPTKKDMYAIHWAANLRMLKSATAVSVFMAIALIPLFLYWFIFALTGPLTFDGNKNPLIISGILLSGMLVFLIAQHIAFMIAIDLTYVPFVRREICSRGTPICIECGHLLAEKNDVCSECGKQE